MVKLGVLGSGSRGNAFVISSADGAIIVDVGFSRRETRCRMEQLHLRPERLDAALLTHEHDDHSKGCRVFCDELGIPLCTAPETANYLRRKGKLPERVIEFEPGGMFSVGGFDVFPFAVQHDAVNPVGFIIRYGTFRIGVATDLGNVNALALRHLADCDALILESNYDEQMLRNSDRQLYLKRRILGRNGHLDNRAALAALDRLLTRRTRLLLLAHLSGECNSPELVERLFANRLREMGRADIEFGIIRQDVPLGVYELSSDGVERSCAC